MGNENISAVAKFKDVLNENGVFTSALSTEVFETTVIVEDYSDEEIFNFSSMKVKLSDCNVYVNVNIMWEDCGLRNYKKHNLYGYYSTGYCKMEYIDDSKEFIIYSEDNKIIIEVPKN
ncbi:hypothetical protein [Clostridium cochlearium]|uniref:hypothetical protein n=1 Tax=Clostridium cochlearium TaxID=1494 RepID=UPI0022E7A843|nr:hypothetical protein [Clostridium cochlearium]